MMMFATTANIVMTVYAKRLANIIILALILNIQHVADIAKILPHPAVVPKRLVEMDTNVALPENVRQ